MARYDYSPKPPRLPVALLCGVCGESFKYQPPKYGARTPGKCQECKHLTDLVECPCGRTVWRTNPQQYCSKVCWRRYRARVAMDEKTRKGRRRALESAAAGLSQAARGKLLKLWVRERRRCWACDRLATTVDHVIPLLRGGDHREGNLLPACKSCNSSRGSRLISEWRHRRALARSAA